MSLELNEIWKSYGDLPVLKGLNLKARKGEFLVILGPSGCGKTTTLHIIAGILRQDKGDVIIDGRIVNSSPPEDRPVGLVFQDYLLFPHLTVFENVAFGLKVRKLHRDYIKRKVNEVLELLRIDALKDRYPNSLSGGEKQRVALARALVLEPKILLLDEPLSNLDANTRKSLRFELKNLHRKLGMSIVYVTHDQAEALTLADRLAVLHDGVIEQVGEPHEVFFKPKTEFVASFVGAENRFRGYVNTVDVKNRLAKIQMDDLEFIVPLDEGLKPGEQVCISIRPDDISITPEKCSGLNAFSGVVEDLFFMGSMIRMKVSIGDHYVVADVPRRLAHEYGLTAGKVVHLKIEPNVIACIRNHICKCRTP